MASLEIGVALPSIVTGDDIVAAAIEEAMPNVPRPIAPTDDVAERTGESLLAVAAPGSLPVTVDRLGALATDPVEADPEALLASAPVAVVAGSVLDRLADGPGILGRALEITTGVGTQIVRGASAVWGFITDNTVTRAVMSFSFFVAAFVVGTLCSLSGVCFSVFGVALPIVVAFHSGGIDGLLGAITTAFLEPLRTLARQVLTLDPTALLAAAVTVIAYRAGASFHPRLATLRAKVVSPVCRVNHVVCISTGRFGAAAEHVVDAQRLGAPRILRIDRAGAEARRMSALRSLPVLAGFDRDEYPFAISSRRAGLSIRYIDPTSNRALGSYLGRQLGALPDGARFLVLPIA